MIAGGECADRRPVIMRAMAAVLACRCGGRADGWIDQLLAGFDHPPFPAADGAPVPLAEVTLLSGGRGAA